MKLQEARTFSVRVDRKGADFVYPVSFEWSAADRARIPALVEGREEIKVGETTYRKVSDVASGVFWKKRTITYSRV